MTSSKSSKSSARPYWWVIRAGRSSASKADQLRNETLFLSDRRVGLDDPFDIGDVSGVDRMTIRTALEKKDPTLHPSALSGFVSNLVRFAEEMAKHDVVMCPSRFSSIIHIGTVSGAYMYVPDCEFPHSRNVKWIGSFDRTTLSIAAQYELGAARLFFQFRRHVHEVNAFIRNK